MIANQIGLHSVLLLLQIHKKTNNMYTEPFLYSRLYVYQYQVLLELF